MSLIDNIKSIFGKSGEPNPTPGSRAIQYTCVNLNGFCRPTVADRNFMTLFNEVPEVFFAIHYIASRVAGGNFILRKAADDSVVFNNKEFEEMKTRANCLESFHDLVYSHFVYKLATGNSYFKSAIPSLIQNSKLPRYKRCRNYWVVPPTFINIVPFARVPIFGIANTEDIIQYYMQSSGRGDNEKVNPSLIFHDADGHIDYTKDFLKGHSRLESQMKPISNLIAVYEARNVIYTKRGALGLIVSAKSDDSGSVALTEDEKKNLRESYNKTYGLGTEQFPYSVSDVPVEFIRTNLSITELQPFDETLADAIEIAGAFGIPAVLVPRKDQSTFSNQATAEKTVYTSTVIPMAKEFCDKLTSFLGYDRDGLYIDVDFSHVDCLAEGNKEKEEVLTLKTNRAYSEFSRGLITLNDYRARIGESKVEMPLFDKLLFEMTPEEQEAVKTIVNIINSKISNNERKEGVEASGSKNQGE